MTIWNLGSINADFVYRVPHLPAPGETLASSSYTRGLGGKGANMSVAAARAGARVAHLGAIGSDGGWMLERLMEYGVDTRAIDRVSDASGHAIIAVDDAGENQIILYPGANHAISETRLADRLREGAASDLFLFQNETNAQAKAAALASGQGMRVVYAAAPFDAAAVSDVLPLLDLLILNAVEARQLEDATGLAPAKLPVRDVVVTRGSEGATWFETDGGTATDIPAIPADAKDTTGAGDTFTGYLCAGLDRGFSMRQSLDLATKAAAIMVGRVGTADVIPDLKDIEDRFGPDA
ncbi:Ribokinase [Roseivivax sp. THAF40]|uniref:PfkB family carbohydrate kinase n=1 Tax=unclassified Roseivivax TaxID=2639302 RepID=UPI001268358B|nr:MULTISPECIES: PfkB family carbohydrate kinase [unclassified Roseivivax]QFS84715.1 Ribokinase [Roseivivax sp. THAF197b]QFT48542.1 Ribokinase [Roseivivax sp. THAF40]